MPRRRLSTILLTLLIVACQLPCGAAAEYSFELEEFSKKSLQWGGHLELKGEHLEINESGAFGRLAWYGEPRADLDRLTATLQLEGNYSTKMVAFNWLAQAHGRQDQEQWADDADIFAAYASLKPSPLVTLDLGKKAFRWGKGYAWNPVAFIDRPKDSNNPEEALEGYVGAGLDLIKSFSGPLQTVALTTVALPVGRDVNEDFGAPHNVNLAAKLYLLYRDVDLDFLLYSGNSRTSRYGLDFSTNLASNFEIHAELAHIPSQSRRLLRADGLVEMQEFAATSYLLGLRYLTENEITAIIEYYHNDEGYSEEEQARFYALVADAHRLYEATADDSLYRRAAQLSQGAYGRPQIGRNYLYARLTWKEPFELLYFTPGCTAIVNLDDDSFSLSPEAVYSGFTNWELRLRFTLLEGSDFSEYGEKQNDNRLELRLRYFF
jgi:hypothetical protein